MQMASAGFTIAPLSTKYQAAGVSQECLVTMVLKLDLGGWLSEQSRMGWLLRPFMHGIHSSYLEPMLMSVIALRDKVCACLPAPAPPFVGKGLHRGFSLVFVGFDLSHRGDTDGHQGSSDPMCLSLPSETTYMHASREYMIIFCLQLRLVPCWLMTICSCVCW